MPTAVSLFTGCGGSDAGLVDAGYEILMANDILPYARDVYEANLPDTEYVLRDIADIRSFPRADILVGCYPCQGYSVGGVRDPDRNVNYMYREFERALRIVKPKAFVVENVSGMRRSNNEHLFANQIKRFRLAGYRVKCDILDARDFGVPQDRARLFFVGIRSDFDAEYSFPRPTHARMRDQAKRDRLPTCPTIKDAIGDLPLWPDHEEYDRQKFHWYYLSRNRYRGWSEFSRTIVATSRHAPLHPVSPRLVRVGTDEWKFASKGPARRLSYREGARLQGFKRRMVFPEKAYIRMRYQVVGNAVPPPVFRAVVEALPDIF